MKKHGKLLMFLGLVFSSFALMVGAIGFSAASGIMTETAAASLSATYTVSSKTSVSTSGTAPSGSSATYSQTYGTVSQMTKGNSITLTLTGYDGCTITGLSLSMKSNTGSGSGSMSFVSNATTISSITSSAFNTSNWNGAWSTSYVAVTPSVTSTTISSEKTVVLTITASANSLYFQAATVTYTAPTSFRVTYDANGGSSAPSDATNYALGATVTVASVGSMTRTNYEFVHWNLKADDSGSSYDPGDTFSITADTKLYAIWNPTGVMITYNGNGNDGGTVPTDATVYSPGASTTVLGNTGSLTKSFYRFIGWNTKDDGTGLSYAAGSSITLTSDTTLYADWLDPETDRDGSGTILFGSGDGRTSVNATSVSGNDSAGNRWTVTTVGTSSFNPSSEYAQIGSKGSPASSITFTTTLSTPVKIVSFRIAMGGFNDTAGTVTLKVGSTTVGTGSLNGTSDVTIFMTGDYTVGNSLTITVGSIAKGVKVYSINYSYKNASLSSISVKTDPTKTWYELGDTFDPTGLVITRNFTGGASDDVTYAGNESDFSFSPSVFSETTDEVTVTFGGKSATIDVTAAELNDVTITGSISATRNGTWDLSGLTVTGTWSDGTDDVDITDKCVLTCSTTTSNYSLTSATVSVQYSNGSYDYDAIEKSGVSASIQDSISDVIDIAFTDTTTYGDWSKAGSTTATYSGHTGGSSISNYVSLTNESPSGIVSTVSAGTVASISVVWDSWDSNKGAILDVYGKNSAYTAGSDLYGSGRGDLIGRIEPGDSNPVVLTVHGNYSYVGIRAYNKALHVTSITIEWTTRPSAGINKSSIVGLKGESDSTSVKIDARNFTPTSVEFAYSTSGKVTASAGAWSANSTICPITLSYSAETTSAVTVTITIKGAATGDLVVYLSVQVRRKPKSIEIYHEDISEGELEVKEGGSRTLTIRGVDTEDEPITFDSSDYTLSVDNGTGFHLDGNVLHGDLDGETGTVTVSYAYLDLEDTLDVSCLADYPVAVASITFNSGLQANQGDLIDAEDIFATHTKEMYFGTIVDIDLDEFRYSYDSGDANPKAASSFQYDFSHGTPGSQRDGKDTKNQTIYVFLPSLDWTGSFAINIKEHFVAATSINITNATWDDVEDWFDVEITRGDTFTISASLLPANTTEVPEFEYSIFTADTGSVTAVSDSGVVTIGNVVGAEAILLIETPVRAGTLETYLHVTIAREDQVLTIKSSANYTYQKVTDTKDVVDGRYLIVCEGASGLVFDGSKDASLDSSGNTVSSSPSAGTITGGETLHAAEFTIGTADGSNRTICSAGGYYVGKTSADNGMDVSDSTVYTNTIAIDDGDNAVITGTGGYVLQYNSSGSRYRYYNKTQKDIQLYKYTSMSYNYTEVSIDDSLFNTVLAFGDNIVCDDQGVESLIDWSAVKTEYAKLNSTNKGYLTNGVSNPSGNEVEVFLSLYDYIVGKYGTETYDDFLNRDPAPIASARVVGMKDEQSPLTTTLWVVLGSGLAGLAAIGAAYWISKKRRMTAE